LNNISNVSSEAALISQIKAGMAAAVGSDSVQVTIHFIAVNSLYGGFSSINADDIITAYAAMAGINISQVTVNNATHSSFIGGRRLSLSQVSPVSSSDAAVGAKVENTDGVDVVAESQRIIVQNSANGLTSQLKLVNPATYANVSCTLPNTPIAALSATTVINWAQAAPDVVAIQTQLASAIGGGATVIASVTSVTTDTQPPTTPSTDHAAIASMITIWVAAYAFAMS
jgi:hypothetical protein